MHNAEGEYRMSTSPDDSINAIRLGIQMEYKALRDESLKRIELRQQLATITLTLAGVFLGVGLNTNQVALLYPPLATFLAFGWSQNDIRIRDIGVFIREHYESTIPGLQWETFLAKQRQTEKSPSTTWLRKVVLSHGGIFLFSQIMAIGIGLSKFSFTPVEQVLLGIDLVFVIPVVWLLAQARR
jgi:hypothetical protein